MLIFLKGEVMRAKKGGSLRIFYVKAKGGGGIRRCKNTFRYECVCGVGCTSLSRLVSS